MRAVVVRRCGQGRMRSHVRVAGVRIPLGRSLSPSPNRVLAVISQAFSNTSLVLLGMSPTTRCRLGHKLNALRRFDLTSSGGRSMRPWLVLECFSAVSQTVGPQSSLDLSSRLVNGQHVVSSKRTRKEDGALGTASCRSAPSGVLFFFFFFGGAYNCFKLQWSPLGFVVQFAANVR